MREFILDMFSRFNDLGPLSMNCSICSLRFVVKIFLSFTSISTWTFVLDICLSFIPHKRIWLLISTYIVLSKGYLLSMICNLKLPAHNWMFTSHLLVYWVTSTYLNINIMFTSHLRLEYVNSTYLHIIIMSKSHLSMMCNLGTPPYH